MARNLDLQIKDTVFEPGSQQKIVYYWPESNTTLYKVWILLDGIDLPYVDSVTYRLHSTFSDPNRRVKRTVANQNCQLIIWTWGLFRIRARVVDKTGRIHEFVHDMRYAEEISLPEAKFQKEKP